MYKFISYFTTVIQTIVCAQPCYCLLYIYLSVYQLAFYFFKILPYLLVSFD